MTLAAFVVEIYSGLTVTRWPSKGKENKEKITMVKVGFSIRRKNNFIITVGKLVFFHCY
jgi:hypothetical protein